MEMSLRSHHRCSGRRRPLDWHLAELDRALATLPDQDPQRSEDVPSHATPPLLLLSCTLGSLLDEHSPTVFYGYVEHMKTLDKHVPRYALVSPAGLFLFRNSDRGQLPTLHIILSHSTVATTHTGHFLILDPASGISVVLRADAAREWIIAIRAMVKAIASAEITRILNSGITIRPRSSSLPDVLSPIRGPAPRSMSLPEVYTPLSPTRGPAPRSMSLPDITSPPPPQPQPQTDTTPPPSPSRRRPSKHTIIRRSITPSVSTIPESSEAEDSETSDDPMRTEEDELSPPPATTQVLHYVHSTAGARVQLQRLRPVSPADSAVFISPISPSKPYSWLDQSGAAAVDDTFLFASTEESSESATDASAPAASSPPLGPTGEVKSRSPSPSNQQTTPPPSTASSRKKFFKWFNW